jgi:PTH1 family peptidyl-tRNA hydrolase
VRIGIGHPGHKDRVHGWVLSDFAKSDEAWLDPLLEAIAKAAPLLAENAAEKFMTQVAQNTQAA